MSDTTPTPIVLDVAAAAAVVRMSPRQLVKLTQSGLVPHIDLGDGEPRFRLEDLSAWVESRRKLPSQAVQHD